MRDLLARFRRMFSFVEAFEAAEPTCRQRRVGIASDEFYRAMPIVRCESCGRERTVKRGMRRFCFIDDGPVRR